MNDADLSAAKQAVRERIWDLLERKGAAPVGVHGHIPDFTGKQEAADRLAAEDVWRAARVIKCNPDRAQLPVRVHALQDGKLLYMAVPRLATLKPFYLLDPADIHEPFEVAASSEGAERMAGMVDTDEMQPIDLIVSGSVAVDCNGHRIGKGAGYADIEVALLSEAGLVRDSTTFSTTVHDLQFVDSDLPATEHDFAVDLTITPTRTMRHERRPRRFRLNLDSTNATKVDAIPILRTRLSRGG